MTIGEQLWQEGFEEGFQQGFQQAFRIGFQEILQHGLTQRFGPIPAHHCERLERATTDQLHTLADRVLAVSSLDELFAMLTQVH